VAELEALAGAGAWAELGAAAHRLAGAAGAYGFDAIAREAKEVERLARGPGGPDRAGVARARVAALDGLCAAARGQWLAVGAAHD
jgi:HPt (histidine-containing phosphotransfer) domain-containing protein